MSLLHTSLSSPCKTAVCDTKLRSANSKKPASEKKDSKTLRAEPKHRFRQGALNSTAQPDIPSTTTHPSPLVLRPILVFRALLPLRFKSRCLLANPAYSTPLAHERQLPTKRCSLRTWSRGGPDVGSIWSPDTSPTDLSPYNTRRPHKTLILLPNLCRHLLPPFRDRPSAKLGALDDLSVETLSLETDVSRQARGGSHLPSNLPTRHWACFPPITRFPSKPVFRAFIHVLFLP